MKSSRRGNGRASYSVRYRNISVLALMLLGAPATWADLTAVRTEPNLERRSERAVEYANEALTAARQAYQEGKLEPFKTQVAEVQAASELSVQSLEETGKSGRKHPKYFKKAELAVRMLLRRIESLRQEVSIDDRESMDQLKAKVETVHDRLLQDLMEKRK